MAPNVVFFAVAMEHACELRREADRARLVLAAGRASRAPATERVSARWWIGEFLIRLGGRIGGAELDARRVRTGSASATRCA